MVNSQTEWWVAVLGYSHLIQLPMTALLAFRTVRLAPELGRLSPVNAQIVRVLGGAAVVLLVGLGLLVATHPSDVLETALGRALALFLGTFWSARFLVQLVYGRAWPDSPGARIAHYFLCFVFLGQGSAYLLVSAA